MMYGFFALAYLLGSIPTAVWMGKWKYNLDIREHGSKNAGATNTFRVLGKKAGTVVLLIDVIKGVTAVTIPLFLAPSNWDTEHIVSIQLVCGILAVLGHIFPVFAGFRGGKGVATSLGIVIGIHPMTALVSLGLFLIVFIIFQYVSLGAIVAAISFPLILHFAFKNEHFYLFIFSIVLSIAVVAAHHKNIKRLLAGNENKMNLFKK
jgi:acyl phosphate:glycerol-3-phosphate acyltransferase